MRIKPDCKLCELYNSRKDFVYGDSRCRVTRHGKGLVCILEEHTNKVSKRQREWLHLMLNKIARRELGEDFRIEDIQKTKHYHLVAFKDEKKRVSKKPRSKA